MIGVRIERIIGSYLFFLPRVAHDGPADDSPGGYFGPDKPFSPHLL